jgi:hypothetical protein
MWTNHKPSAIQCRSLVAVVRGCVERRHLFELPACVGGLRSGWPLSECVVLRACQPLVRSVHAAPLAPRQHLQLGERRKVTDRVPADFSHAPRVVDAGYAEGVGIDRTAAMQSPRLSSGEKPAGREVLRAIYDAATEHLGVDADPPLIPWVPVLRDPVVDAPTREEVGPEAAPCSGRYAVQP